MPVRIQDEIADPGEALKEIDLPGVLGSGFIVEGSAADQAHYRCRCRKAGLSVGNLFDDAPPCSCRAQYSETPRRWHLGYQIVIVTAARFGLTWIIDDHFGRPKDFVAAALIGLKYDMVRLRGVMAHADGFVIERVE